MYDPRIGRFLEDDPKGFAAGDADLYRYVHNNPANRSDPSGLQPAPIGNGGAAFTGGTLVERGTAYETTRTIGLIAGSLVSCGLWGGEDEKSTLLNGIRIYGRFNFRNPPAGTPLTEAIGGRFYSGVIPESSLLGTSGCGPCIGVILVPSNPRNQETIAMHFSIADDPAASLRRLLGPPEAIDQNDERALADINRTTNEYRAIINGGERRTSTTRGMLRTLRETIAALRDYGIPISGYVPAPNVAVDNAGNLYWTTPSSVPTTGY